MPTYQYRCTECGHDLEAVQKFTDPALTECPNCSGSLRKVFNAVGVVFKGSGFYRTDSRAGQRNGENGSGEKSEKADRSGKAEKSESGSSDQPAKSDKSDSGPKKSGSAGKDSGDSKQPAAAGASSTGKGTPSS